MDSKLITWQTIKGFKVTNYGTLWREYVRDIPGITAVDMDNIILQLCKEGKIDIFPPDTDETSYIANKRHFFVGEWAICR